ncbi:site-specific DNA-methyltransferase [Helicobacter pylori]|uniref:site-specific DNA-methyltransferase n=1 Tax=Helicobacter pylori TaxID=210 RepID=UPI000A48C4AA
MHDRSGYELTWTGKGLANALYSQPCFKQLKLQESFTPQTSASKHPNNAIIIGDNLDCLKLLKSAYSEKIKMIYIDPPYNTQSDEFIYPDNFRQDYQKILREVGLMEIDENGKETESESLKFFKNIQGSGTHSGWLSFMLPRLKLARDLLKEDGVIFISIDDNECAQLKLLCDEIFGEDNFVNTIIWEKKYSPQNHTKWFSDNHDFILLYAKDKEIWRPILLPRTSEMNARYKNLDNDERGVWKSSDLSVGSAVERNIYPIFNPYTKQEIYPPHGRSWVYSQEKLQELIADNRIFFPTSGSGVPCYKRFLNEVKQGTTPLTIWKYTEVGHTQDAKREIKEIFDGQALFDTPKPKALLKRILEISTQENDIILDFFAGSGTTAHAVMELNAEDKGNREFILVQIDEEIKEYKSAYDFCKNVLKSAKPVISDITIERVKRAAQKIIQSSKESGLDLGFKVYTLEDKVQIANDKEGITLFHHSHLTPFDKALNLALQCGKTLNQPLETIIKDKLYKCEDAYFCIVCDEETQEYLAKSGNERIFLDGYEEIDLEAFLNLNASFKERLSVVY